MNNSGHASVAERKMGERFLVPKGKRRSVGALEFLLREVLLDIQPSQEDHDKRQRIIANMPTFLQDLESLKGASINPFGSFVSNLYTRWGDLDISIELLADGQQSSEIGKNKKKRILTSIYKALTKRGVGSVQLILSARVPLVIFEDPHSQISCDISINNGSGLFKSKFLYWLSQIDTRCRELVYLIKHWAKAHNINDPKTGTLNSFSLTLLVIFHLQTQSPPILPPVKDIYDGDIASDVAGKKVTDEIQIENKCIQNVQKFKQQGFGSENKNAISDLFVSFFFQYASVSEKWLKGLSVCTFTGKWGNTFSRECQIKKQYAMTIEDPFDRTENCARSVTESTLKLISDEFEGTYQSLKKLPVFSQMNLRQSLFGSPHGMLRSNVLPSQETTMKTSRKFDEDNMNKGTFIQVSETTYNPKMQCKPQPLAANSLDFLPSAFSQGCSLEEWSMPRQPNVVSTSPSIYRHQAQPSYSYGATLRHQHKQDLSERKQQLSSTSSDFTMPVPRVKTWKPKDGSRVF